jgi:ketosteroid isomerase-like protein
MNQRIREVIMAGMLLQVWSAFVPPARAAEEEKNDGAMRANQSLLQAMAKSDAADADKLLDAEFTWTDRTGKTLGRKEALAAFAKPGAETDSDVTVGQFGDVVLVRGVHKVGNQNDSVRFARVWVKRAKGWQALIYQETNKAEKTPAVRSGFGAPSNGSPVDCENPCKSVPYKPEGSAEQEVVSMWQAVERTVLTNDVEAWIPNFTDDFVFVTPDGGAPLNRDDRVAMIKELRRTNTRLIPAKVESMKVWVLGDTAVMRSEHKPMHGRMLHVTRVLVKRAGHWQITFGQQTALEPEANHS